MNQKFLYNEMVRFYNRSRRKLKSLAASGKNLRKQDILKRRIARLFELLTGMQHALGVGAAALAITAGMVLFQPNAAKAQAFAAVVNNPFSLTDIGYLSSPSFADLDNDGDLDLMAGEISGNFKYFQNTGSNTSPAFAAVVTNPFGLTAIGPASNPTFADLDNDGDLDLMAVANPGNFKYFQNIGSGIHAPAFAAVATNPFGLTYIVFLCSPAFADLDNDGDLDLMAGEFYYGNFKYFQNTGSNTSPAFAAVVTNPFGLTAIGHSSNPTFADLDNDGDLDLMAGESSGNFKYFQNIGSGIHAPAFAAVGTNPFGLTGIGQKSKPTFVDLDNDGDLDLMAGEFFGNFKYFQNTSCISPTITCPANQTANTSGACSAVKSYSSSSTGTPAPAITYTFTGATTNTGTGNGSGSTFNVGTTTVKLTATNACGTATCTFTVAVSDNENPTITCPANTTVTANNAGCTYNGSIGTATALDNCSSGLTISGPVPAGPYPVGITIVTWTVTDASGNTATCNQSVTVDPLTVTSPPNPDPGTPPYCRNPGVILTKVGSAPGGVTWYWQTSVTGTSTALPATSPYPTLTIVGTYTIYVRAQDDATGCWSTETP